MLSYPFRGSELCDCRESPALSFEMMHDAAKTQAHESREAIQETIFGIESSGEAAEGPVS